MNIPNPFSNKAFKYIFIVTAILSLIYVVLRLLLFTSDPILPFFTSIYEQYLYLAEGIISRFFKLSSIDVIIRDHIFIFENETGYQLARSNFLEKWQRFLLNKYWSALILVLIWGTISSIRKKAIFSIFFLITHFISVLSGLYLIGIAGPKLFTIKPDFFLSPTLIGTLLMFAFLSAWIKLSKNEIQKTLQKLKIKFILPDRKINEILVVLFSLLLLRSFVIAFFDFPNYVHFLLETTIKISSLFGHDGYIVSDQLVGNNGALALSKHCLGFLTMFVFASMVYLTRPKKKKTTWVYMISGLVFLLILNIIRLVAVFIVAQGENGFERANLHHEVYNIVIYVIIFVLWVVWFEFFVGWKTKE